MLKKTSITLDENSYLFAVKHGKRNEYIERLLKKRFRELRFFLFYLKMQKNFKEEEILTMIKDLSLPAGAWEVKNISVTPEYKDALISLWEETRLAGITAEELLKLLNVNEGNGE